MKALSIKQPHADWILYKGKDIENRTWNLPRNMKGERIYIHAGKRVDTCVAKQSDYADSPERLGAIIGEVTIVDCVFEDKYGDWHGETDSDWYNDSPGIYGFILEDPVAYEIPIPCRGKLGFFEPDI